MTKRLCIHDVKKRFLDEECLLLSNDYKNNSQKLKFLCSCGKVSESSLVNFQAGKRGCCGYEKRINKSKIHLLKCGFCEKEFYSPNKNKKRCNTCKYLKRIDRSRVWLLNCTFCKKEFYSHRSDTRRCKTCKFFQNGHVEPKKDFSILNRDLSYIAGFMFGDGSSDGKSSIRIGLARKKVNYKLLEKIRNVLFYTNNSTDIKQYGELFHLVIYSKKIVENLKKFGIDKNKTYDNILKLPKGIESDFIRGYFDADGWISIRKNKQGNKIYRSYSLGLCSYLEENLIKVNNLLPVKGKISKKTNQELYELRWYSVENIIKIRDFLYYDDCLCLESKKWKLMKVGKLKPKIYYCQKD